MNIKLILLGITSLCVTCFFTTINADKVCKNDAQTQSWSQGQTSKYITQQVVCGMSTLAKTNINNIEIISIDSYPDSFKYNKYIKRNITIPNGTEIEAKYCYPHADNTMGGALGINRRGIPSLKRIKVNFIPALSCFGTGYEPFLINAINQAILVASNNTKYGKKTIVVYSIGGGYNTREKIEAMRKLTEIKDTYVVTVIGNNEQQYDNCASSLLKNVPKLIIVGGTQGGNKLLNISMIGLCVNYYAPGIYRSPVTSKQIKGVSYAGPIVANLIINYFLNNFNSTREDMFQFLDSKTDTVIGYTKYGDSTPMRIFRKEGLCRF